MTWGNEDVEQNRSNMSDAEAHALQAAMLRPLVLLEEGVRGAGHSLHQVALVAQLPVPPGQYGTAGEDAIVIQTWMHSDGSTASDGPDECLRAAGFLLSAAQKMASRAGLHIAIGQAEQRIRKARRATSPRDHKGPGGRSRDPRRRRR